MRRGQGGGSHASKSSTLGRWTLCWPPSLQLRTMDREVGDTEAVAMDVGLELTPFVL